MATLGEALREIQRHEPIHFGPLASGHHEGSDPVNASNPRTMTEAYERERERHQMSAVMLGECICIDNGDGLCEVCLVAIEECPECHGIAYHRMLCPEVYSVATKFNAEWARLKDEFAQREQDQEERAFRRKYGMECFCGTGPDTIHDCK